MFGLWYLANCAITCGSYLDKIDYYLRKFYKICKKIFKSSIVYNCSDGKNIA